MAEKEMTMDEAYAKLQEILAKMDNDDLSLEENFSLYEEGIKLVKLCNEKLDKIEKQIIKLEESQEQ